MLLTSVIKMLSEKSGYSLRYSSDCERLAIDIEVVTGERLGNTTMKRMLGFTGEDTCPRLSSLDIIARYLGFTDYDHLLQHINNTGESDFVSVADIDAKSIHAGDIIKIEYSPNRHVDFTALGECRFCVSVSHNSKLRVGDVVEVRQFAKGFPLICSSVEHGGTLLGSFVAGKIDGLTSLKHIKATEIPTPDHPN